MRYAGLKGCADYKKAAQIIKDGGYATSLSYVSSLCSLIEKWNLTQYDLKSPVASKEETKESINLDVAQSYNKKIKKTYVTTAKLNMRKGASMNK